MVKAPASGGYNLRLHWFCSGGYADQRSCLDDTLAFSESFNPDNRNLQQSFICILSLELHPAIMNDACDLHHGGEWKSANWCSKSESPWVATQSHAENWGHEGSDVDEKDGDLRLNMESDSANVTIFSVTRDEYQCSCNCTTLAMEHEPLHKETHWKHRIGEWWPPVAKQFCTSKYYIML